ncbi:hypothetical protein MXB_5450 [Myxobolus squamalis]|nr:hypothetical protein MXB_5450 [Myxobolus squamalis]
MFNFSYNHIIKSTYESLARLKLEYIDILFAHDIEFSLDQNLILSETIPALKFLKDHGKTKNIGISGYSLSFLKDIIVKSTIKIDFVITYSRYTIFDDTLKDFLSFFEVSFSVIDRKEQNIVVINGSPTGMGLLTQSGPPYWHPAHQTLKDSCKLVVSEFEKYNLNVSECAVKYALNNQLIDVLLIGPKNIDELINCCKASHQKLTPEDERFIKKIQNDYIHNLSAQVRSWEGVEVENYRKQLEQFKKCNPS